MKAGYKENDTFQMIIIGKLNCHKGDISSSLGELTHAHRPQGASFNFSLKNYLLMAAHRPSLVATSRGYSLVAVCGLLITLASLIRAWAPEHWASVAAARGWILNHWTTREVQESFNMDLPLGLSLGAI